MNVLTILLAGQGGGDTTSTFLMFGMIFVVFYFFMIRPQTKKAKETKKFREALSKGDRIVTIGGIHGKIEEVKDETIVIAVEGGNRLKVEKSAISLDTTSQLQDSAS
jgi:preprotein translocase subunit YajC